MNNKTELQRQLEYAYHRDHCFCEVIPEASEELSRLRQELSSARERLTKAWERIDELEHEKAENASLRELLFHKDARIAALESALKPFADAYHEHHNGYEVEYLNTQEILENLPGSITTGDLRRAASALEGKAE